MVSPLEIAQQLFQGQRADIAPTTGIAPQPQLRPEQAAVAQALQERQAPQREFATPQGASLASELLGVSQDRLGNPIIRGLAGFLGTRELQKERERAGEERRVAKEERTAAAEAAAQQQELENVRAERALAEKEATGRAQRGKFEAETAKLEKEALGGGDPKELREAEQKVRKEFTNLSKDFFKQRDAFGRVQASAKDPSAAGDLALIFNFMKVLDPGSTVREGEFATAESSGSIPSRITARYNKILEGERLSPKQRADFLNRGERLFESADAQHNVRVDAFTGLSERTGLDPKNVTLDLSLAQEEATKDIVKETAAETVPNGQSILEQVSTQAQFDALPSGAIFTENGQTFRKP
ncbi:MAG: hypothetical protein V3V81_07380 [Candidatus Bathyarchaeia archaeon]